MVQYLIMLHDTNIWGFGCHEKWTVKEVLILTEMLCWEGYRLALHFVMSEKFAMFDFFSFALFFGELIFTTNGHYSWILELILCSFHGRLWLAEGCHRITVATRQATQLVFTPIFPTFPQENSPKFVSLLANPVAVLITWSLSPG